MPPLAEVLRPEDKDEVEEEALTDEDDVLIGAEVVVVEKVVEVEEVEEIDEEEVEEDEDALFRITKARLET